MTVLAHPGRRYGPMGEAELSCDALHQRSKRVELGELHAHRLHLPIQRLQPLVLVERLRLERRHATAEDRFLLDIVQGELGVPSFF